MSDYTVLPSEISAAIDQVARTRAKGKTPDDLRFARLQVLVDLRARAKEAELEVVKQLRPAHTWSEIAEGTNASVNAVFARYLEVKGSVDEPESDQGPKGEYTVTEASRETGLSRPTIMARVQRSEGATWFRRMPKKNRSGFDTRITDLSGLEAAVYVRSRKGSTDLTK